MRLERREERSYRVFGYDATFENGVWTIKVQAAETYILTAAR